MRLSLNGIRFVAKIEAANHALYIDYPVSTRAAVQLRLVNPIASVKGGPNMPRAEASIWPG
jgi:hypothetical protein